MNRNGSVVAVKMEGEIAVEVLQQIHQLSSELAQLKLSYVQDISNMLTKLETLESAHKEFKSLFEQMRSTLVSHCENEKNLVQQLRHSDDFCQYVYFYDISEKVQRVRDGERLVSLGSSGKFTLSSHEFLLYAEIGRRQGLLPKLRLYLKEYRPMTSFTILTWPVTLMLEVSVCGSTKNFAIGSRSPLFRHTFVMNVDFLSLDTLVQLETLREKDYICISLRAASRQRVLESPPRA